MCGIVGFVGSRDAQPILLDCLKRLEYRGYDSAGIAVIGQGLQLYKAKGEIAQLESGMPAMKGSVGIAHTRWATQGKPTTENAHPFSDCTQKLAVVHNGIISNFLDIRESLSKAGHKFTSETDSEMFAHLVEAEYQGDLVKSVFQALKKSRGHTRSRSCPSARKRSSGRGTRARWWLVSGTGRTTWPATSRPC